jgi:hypothetical protein
MSNVELPLPPVESPVPDGAGVAAPDAPALAPALASPLAPAEADGDAADASCSVV